MLDIFGDIGVNESKMHDKFKMLKDNLIFGEKDVLKQWTEKFIDRDNKIIKEFQTTFHSSFWEFFLNALFIEAGFEIDYTESRPDFIVISPQKMYVEAVVANIKEVGTKENERNINNVLSMVKPFYMQKNFKDNLSESVTRYSNSIQYKAVKKYKDYIKDEHFDDSLPYLIAMSGYEQIDYGNNFVFPMMALLYGRVYDNLTDTYVNKTEVKKPGTESTIPVGIFLDDSYSHVSAIIYSCTNTLGKLTSLAISQGLPNINSVLTIRQDCDLPTYKIQLVSEESPEYLSDGVFIFHNPNANNPISEELFNKTNVINVLYDESNQCSKRKGNNLPIISRLNLVAGKALFPYMEKEIFDSFNPEIFDVCAEVVRYEESEGKYEVHFNEVEDSIEFSMDFDERAFKEYKLEKGSKLIIMVFIELDSLLMGFLINKPEVFHKLKKIHGLMEGKGRVFNLTLME